MSIHFWCAQQRGASSDQASSLDSPGRMMRTSPAISSHWDAASRRNWTDTTVGGPSGAVGPHRLPSPGRRQTPGSDRHRSPIQDYPGHSPRRGTFPRASVQGTRSDQGPIENRRNHAALGKTCMLPAAHWVDRSHLQSPGLTPRSRSRLREANHDLHGLTGRSRGRHVPRCNDAQHATRHTFAPPPAVICYP